LTEISFKVINFMVQDPPPKVDSYSSKKFPVIFIDPNCSTQFSQNADVGQLSKSVESISRPLTKVL
jgi:hypothetical protein